MSCRHYRRRCLLKAACCGRDVRCRLCHDEAVGDCRETMDRFAVDEIVCCECGLRQAVSETCLGCAVRFGSYACLTCRFFDDDEAGNAYFHCDKCGICRRGGRENWVHCDTCGACLRADHAPCVERKLDANCPVCFDRMFDSPLQISVLHCGHPIHADCVVELLANSRAPVPRCPTCCRTMLPPGPEREELWGRLRTVLRETPMPDSETRAVRARCNDCSLEAFETTWHATELYECPACRGFNVQR